MSLTASAYVGFRIASLYTLSCCWYFLLGHAEYSIKYLSNSSLLRFPCCTCTCLIIVITIVKKIIKRICPSILNCILLTSGSFCHPPPHLAHKIFLLLEGMSQEKFKVCYFSSTVLFSLSVCKLM
jgi:hypothetical protein